MDLPAGRAVAARTDDEQTERRAAERDLLRSVAVGYAGLDAAKRCDPVPRFVTIASTASPNGNAYALNRLVESATASNAESLAPVPAATRRASPSARSLSGEPL